MTGRPGRAPPPRPTPRQRIEAECTRRGRAAVAAGCARLLTGGTADPRLVVALGGTHAEVVLADGPRADQEHWFRVWAARGLLWVWHDDATPAVLAALHDKAWRVREKAVGVVARHLVGDALPGVAALRDDPVARVRAAAARAVARLTAAGA